MLILYKNVSDVRFVLFTKTSNKCEQNNLHWFAFLQYKEFEYVTFFFQSLFHTFPLFLQNCALDETVHLLLRSSICFVPQCSCCLRFDFPGTRNFPVIHQPIPMSLHTCDCIELNRKSSRFLWNMRATCNRTKSEVFPHPGVRKKKDSHCAGLNPLSITI